MAMTPEQNNARENKFRERDESVHDFYHTENCRMSEEEKTSLTPILHSVEIYDERYEVLDEIAEGGEKKITLVFDRRLDRKVAMARPVRTETAENRECFLREARLTANLAHPNIIPIHNMGLDPEGIPFFTMELVAANSLKNILKKLREGDDVYTKNYPLDNLLNIFLKICDAIAYSHSRKVLHLDIKPDNIRVGKFGEVFVCDWGVAKIINTDEPSLNSTLGNLDGDILNDMTLSGIMKGSPGFMAPEQTVGDGEMTEQTDLYALGTILYMLLTYESPISGDSVNEVLQNTREGKVVHPNLRRPDWRVPKGLAAVAMKALSFKPTDRYPSVIAMQREINRYLSGHPTLAENAGLMINLSLLMRRHSRITSLLIWFLVIVAGIMSVNMALIMKAQRRAEAEHHKAETNLELYRQEQQEVSLLNTNLQNALISIISNPSFMNFEIMIRIMEIEISKGTNPDVYKQLLVKKGIAHFMMHQLNQANECFDQLDDADLTHVRTIVNLSREFSIIKSSDDIPLTNQQLADLLNETKHTNVRSTLILYYTYLGQIRRFRDRSPEDHLSLTHAMLDKLNWGRTYEQSLLLTKRKEGYHLNLSNTKYKNYTLKIDAAPSQNVLMPLKLYSLDISHTPHTDLSELDGLKLEEVRMVGLKIPADYLLSNLQYLHIKRLIIDADAYPPAILNKIRKKTEVIIEQ